MISLFFLSALLFVGPAHVVPIDSRKIVAGDYHTNAWERIESAPSEDGFQRLVADLRAAGAEVVITPSTSAMSATSATTATTATSGLLRTAENPGAAQVRRWLSSRNIELDEAYGGVIVKDLGLESLADAKYIVRGDLLSAGIPAADAMALLKLLQDAGQQKVSPSEATQDSSLDKCANLFRFCKDKIEWLDILSERSPTSRVVALPKDIEVEVVAGYVEECISGTGLCPNAFESRGFCQGHIERQSAAEIMMKLASHGLSPNRVADTGDGFAPNSHLEWASNFFHLTFRLDPSNLMAQHNHLIAKARLDSRQFAERVNMGAAASREDALDKAIFAAINSSQRFDENLHKSDKVGDTEKVNLVLEFGVFEGVSLRRIAHAFRVEPTDQTWNEDSAKTVVHAFDSWFGLPEDWVQTPLSVQRAHQYSLNGKPPILPDGVVAHAGWFNSTVPAFIKGLTETMPPQLPLQLRYVVSFIHIDCDLYSSTLEALEPLASSGLLVGADEGTSNGTIIFFDEYFGYPGWEEHESSAWKEIAQQYRIDFEFLHYFGQRVAIRVISTGHNVKINDNP